MGTKTEATDTTTTSQAHAKASWKPWKKCEIPVSILVAHPWRGQGTAESPYIVEWLPSDPENPMTWADSYKWLIVVIIAVATLAVSFDSAAFSGGVNQIIVNFHALTELVTAGSLFVLGFALGPLLWGPLSEIAGRRLLFIIT